LPTRALAAREHVRPRREVMRNHVTHSKMLAQVNHAVTPRHIDNTLAQG
jgi:hypothetical protein